mmetsp:Transcript_21772/g.54883  ORF Transcript_21772/g.54883 Transcript_21772/m.54883 type:complete len:224 (-) Transcript_21772:581-1252(-)
MCCKTAEETRFGFSSITCQIVFFSRSSSFMRTGAQNSGRKLPGSIWLIETLRNFTSGEGDSSPSEPFPAPIFPALFRFPPFPAPSPPIGTAAPLLPFTGGAAPFIGGAAPFTGGAAPFVGGAGASVPFPFGTGGASFEEPLPAFPLGGGTAGGISPFPFFEDVATGLPAAGARTGFPPPLPPVFVPTGAVLSAVSPAAPPSASIDTDAPPSASLNTSGVACPG